MSRTRYPVPEEIPDWFAIEAFRGLAESLSRGMSEETVIHVLRGYLNIAADLAQAEHTPPTVTVR